jgi:hypothetical protein
MATTGHYYILPGTGTIQQQGNSVLAFALIQAGFAGPFPTIAAAKAYAQTQTVQNAAHQTGHTVATVANTVPQFLGKLANANLWMRVGEVILGLLLIAVGVAEMTHAVPIATKIASAVK